MPRGSQPLIVDPTGRPAGPRPPPAQAISKELLITLAGMPLFEDSLREANAFLVRNKAIPTKGQRVTLHILATVARWQREALALLEEYAPKPSGEAGPESPRSEVPDPPSTHPAPGSSRATDSSEDEPRSPPPG